MLQTEIIAKINAQSSNLAHCTKSAQIFQKFKQERVRVVIKLTIDANGQIERFKLDDKLYPEEYAECIFKVLNIINFPKIERGEVIELEQPFIFRKS